MTPPFRIDAMRTEILSNPSSWREAFARCPALLIEDAIAPDLLARFMTMANRAQWAPDSIDVGTREIETPQTLGKLISIVLARPSLREWLEEVTGAVPIRAVSGRLARTRPETAEELVWHSDLNDSRRRLAVVVHLSEVDYEGGAFEIRRVGETDNLARFTRCRPGSMAIFAVRPDLEHRVTPLVSGGPRRVFAGWFMSEPEHPGHGVVLRP